MAALARLRLSEDETDRMAHDLDQILDYVATLEDLDTQGIEPTAHAIPLATPLRPDKAVPATMETVREVLNQDGELTIKLESSDSRSE